MRILISNDDGAHAPGIQALANHLAELNHEVYVSAPDRERSTTGHCLTLHKPLRAYDAAEYFNERVKQAWKVNGTPCDSIKLALHHLLDHRSLDLVLSGINRGPNMGADVLYSGTVSAAVEGALCQIPSLAVSLASFDDQHYHTAAYFIGKLLPQIQWEHFPSYNVLNINVPPVEPEAVQAVRVTRLGRPRFKDLFEKREDLRGQNYYWQTGVVENFEEAGTDIEAIHHDCISLTPIHYDMTWRASLPLLEAWNISFPTPKD